MPPRAAVLHWPDGQKASGIVTCEAGEAPAFFAARIDGPLDERRRNKPHLKLIRQPGRIEVDPAVAAGSSRRASVTPRLMKQVPGVHADWLRSLAEVAGGGSRAGLDEDQHLALSNVMRSAVRQIAGACTDPDAAGRAQRALDRPFVLLTFSGNEEDDRYENTTAFASSRGGTDLAEELQHLERGEHLLVRICLGRLRPEAQGPAHALAITATRQSDDTAQLTLINSNGWSKVARDEGFVRAPAIAKTVSLQVAREALDNLRHGVIEPVRGYPDYWHRPPAGVPLYAWLQPMASDSPMGHTRQRMRPQKGPDCAIEMEFALLGSMLHKSDYKLAKAHVLNALLHAAIDNGLPRAVVKRLGERVTSSLSARAMETGR